MSAFFRSNFYETCGRVDHTWMKHEWNGIEGCWIETLGIDDTCLMGDLVVVVGGWIIDSKEWGIVVVVAGGIGRRTAKETKTREAG